MSNRYQAGIIRPGYNALKVPNAPTIGTATAGDTQASVTFTAPSCVGGGAISSYQAFACCGARSAFGSSSPLTVTGLTNGAAYTFKVIANNVYGPSYPSAASNSATPAVPPGQQAYTTAGTYSWVAPAGVTSVSVVAVGTGGSGSSPGYGGGGGALAYANSITVTPGNSYSVVVGAKPGNVLTNGAASSFESSVIANGGTSGYNAAGGVAAGGTVGAGTGGSGGNGRVCNGSNSGSGGGAGGYSGNGGAGGTNGLSGSAGSGGGGGGGAGPGGGVGGTGGGGVGLLGQGCSGAGGAYNSGAGSQGGGGGGSSGQSGYGNCTAYVNSTGGRGGNYGGGASYPSSGGTGYSGAGAVRIIWPGTTRLFPSTNTGDL